MGDCQSKKKVEISDEIEEIEIDRDSEIQPDQRKSGSKPTSERRGQNYQYLWKSEKFLFRLFNLEFICFLIKTPERNNT